MESSFASATADGLQRMIAGADARCAAVGMQASPAKTLVMELTNAELPWGQWTCSCQLLWVVSEARYLGVIFKAGRGCLPTFASLRSKALQAWALLWQQQGRLGCGRSMWLMLQLYQACVMPAGQFVCEVWGLLLLHGFAREARAALAALHLQHLKKLVGLRESAPTPILLSELHQSQISDVWLLRAAGFWNSVVACPGMHRQIALDAVQLAVNGDRSGYVAGLVASLRMVGYDMILAAGSLPEIDVTQLHHNLRTCRDEVWQELHVSPCLAPSANARLCDTSEVSAICQGSHDFEATNISRRCGSCFCSELGAMVLQWTWAGAVALLEQNGLALYVGLALEMRCIERLKMHLVFECAALQMLRDDMPTLVQGVRSMRCLVWQDNMVRMFRFVRDAMRMVRAAS